MSSFTQGTVLYHREIPEQRVEGKRLGRSVLHDSRSLAFRVAPPAKTTVSKTWARKTAILDQGGLGSCTGNAATGALGSEPFYDTLTAKLSAGLKLDENEAVSLYSKATELDPFTGTYLPDDTGSNGLSVAKAAQKAGLISGYVHALSLDDVIAALQTSPVIVGTNWYSGMDDPDAAGLVVASGSVRGGHEYLCRGVDLQRMLLHFDNSWGSAWGNKGSFTYSFDTMTRLLSEDGDATQFVPLSAPAPVPNPDPALPPFEGATVPVAARIAHAAARHRKNVTDYQNHHWEKYFDLA